MASLTFEEAYQYLSTRVVPAVCYAVAVTDIPQKVCGKINTYIDSVMLPKIGLNRHTPKAVVYGPMKLGGLNYPQFKTLQTAKSITYLLKQMQWNGDMAADIRVNLVMTQLMSGMEEPILEQTGQTIDYLPESWVLTIRQRLKALKAKVWIKKIWRPEKQ